MMMSKDPGWQPLRACADVRSAITYLSRTRSPAARSNDETTSTEKTQKSSKKLLDDTGYLGMHSAESADSALVPSIKVEQGYRRDLLKTPTY